MKQTLIQGRRKGSGLEYVSRSRNVLALPLPNSFSGLMEMYEGNYIRLRKLLGDKESSLRKRI